MNFSANVPTVFAKSLAEAARITIANEPGRNHHEYAQKLDRLKAFQQMAVVVPFDDCLISFHGQFLTTEQVGVLKIIYKSTKPWMLGHVVGVLLDKLDNERMANKDFAEAVKTIIEQLTKGDLDENGRLPTNQMKGLMVKLAEVK